MLVIGFYTPEYESISKRLEDSCLDKDIQLELRAYEDRGSWEENCGIKPEFILSMMEEFEQDLFYVDVDAEFARDPDWSQFENEERIGVCCEKINPPKWEVLSGSIFIPYNDITIAIIKGWLRHCQNNPTEWDQIMFAEILNKLSDEQWFRMNIEWCAIESFNIESPIIRQLESSRETK